MSFLPVNKKDMEERGWDEIDFLYISGESYVDHPSFGHAIVTRLLESEGYKVGIISMPNIHNNKDFTVMGRPRLGVMISSGVIDSMVNNYTVSKKKRHVDEYAPGGIGGKRPDMAVIEYCKKIREIFGDIHITIGGVEASLRRVAYYDYWQDKIKQSILVDSTADLLIYGMGENPLWDMCKLLEKGIPLQNIRNVRGTAYLTEYTNLPKNIKENIENNILEDDKIIILESFDKILNSKEAYAKFFMKQYQNNDHARGKILVQKYGDKYYVQNPMQKPLTQKQMDFVYNLPYERTYHPMYEEQSGVPAIKEVEFSITSHRGCFGSCTFCAITMHQGRVIQNRSKESIVDEAKILTTKNNFKGYIHDVGGPSANFRNPSCEKQMEKGCCKNKECLHPSICTNAKISHKDYLEILRAVRKVDGIKKVFIRSGIRYDYLMEDKNDEFFYELCKYHISGQLKVAPEHISSKVLDMMGKPKKETYFKFVDKFKQINSKLKMEQYLVPYLISSHPGSELKDAIELAEYLNSIGHMPEQVQDFYPTPGTIASCMYYAEVDPRTMKKIFVPKTVEEKQMQRALLQYRKKENYNIILKALKLAKREDLIGFTKNCLIKPTKEMAIERNKEKKNIQEVESSKAKKGINSKLKNGKFNKKTDKKVNENNKFEKRKNDAFKKDVKQISKKRKGR